MSDRWVCFLAGLAVAAAMVGAVEQARIRWRDAEIFDLRADVADLEDRLQRAREDCAAAAHGAEEELGAAHDECAEALNALAAYKDEQCNGRVPDLVNAYNGLVDRYNALGKARRIAHIALPPGEHGGLTVEPEGI